MRRLTVFNLVTLDGYFAGPGGDISWHMVDEEFQDDEARHMSEKGLPLKSKGNPFSGPCDEPGASRG